MFSSSVNRDFTTSDGSWLAEGFAELRRLVGFRLWGSGSRRVSHLAAFATMFCDGVPMCLSRESRDRSYVEHRESSVGHCLMGCRYSPFI